MARERKKITDVAAKAAYDYLLSAKMRFSAEARAELEQLLPGELHGRKAPKAEALEAWAERYLKAADRTRMWAALRQQDYARRRKPVRITLARKVHIRLSNFADEHGLTLSDAVRVLLDSIKDRKR